MKWLLINEKGKVLVTNAPDIHYLPTAFSVDADGGSDVVMAMRLNQDAIEEIELSVD